MGLENLRSVFQENIEKLAETFSSNRPQDRNDSKFVFNDVISQTHTFGVTTQEPILDTLLRGRIYQPGSFNPTLIDKALLRKGRLIAEYMFDNLSIDKTNKLFKSLNIDYKTTEPMSLADIYNYEDNLGIDNNKKTKIGF